MLRPEPPPGSVITWFRKFGPLSRTYQFVAIHVDKRGWYLSGKVDRACTWVEVEQLTSGSEFWVAATWMPVGRAWR